MRSIFIYNIANPEVAVIDYEVVLFLDLVFYLFYQQTEAESIEIAKGCTFQFTTY
jgi:hypothetical protein